MEDTHENNINKKRKLEDSEEPQQPSKEEQNPENFQELLLSLEDADKLLEPLTQPQELQILKIAICKHQDILDEVRKIGDLDVSRRKIFIRGIGFDTKPGAIEEVYGAYGSIEDLSVIKDKGTGKNKGYAFLTYKHFDATIKALKEPSKKVGERVTVCNLATQGPRNQYQQPSISQEKNPPITSSNVLPPFASLLPPPPPPQNSRVSQTYKNPAVNPQTLLNPPLLSQSQQNPSRILHNSQNPLGNSQYKSDGIEGGFESFSPPEEMPTDPSLRRVCIANIPPHMPPERLISVFSQYGKIEEGPVGYDNGKFVIFVYTSVDAARKVVEDPVKCIDGHQLFCKLATEEEHNSKQKHVANMPNELPIIQRSPLGATGYSDFRSSLKATGYSDHRSPLRAMDFSDYRSSQAVPSHSNNYIPNSVSPGAGYGQNRYNNESSYMGRDNSYGGRPHSPLNGFGREGFLPRDNIEQGHGNSAASNFGSQPYAGGSMHSLSPALSHGHNPYDRNFPPPPPSYGHNPGHDPYDRTFSSGSSYEHNPYGRTAPPSGHPSYQRSLPGASPPSNAFPPSSHPGSRSYFP